MDANQIPPIVAAVLDRHVQPLDRLILGLSGGLDSVVLLHVLKQLATSHGFQLAAHHVNHGISPNAGYWQTFCVRLCESWGVPFGATTVSVARSSRKGLEAAAREERYRVLGRLDADFVVLAHHRDDQAETLLLQLLRGAGVRGLSGMPEARDRPATSSALSAFLRPLLAVPRQVIEAYARANGLQWIEDESNTDTSYSRNFLRQDILPGLESHFPACRRNLAAAAGHCAEASELLDDLARIDAEGGVRDGRLDANVLSALSVARAKNLLRYFLHRHGLPMPDQARLKEMLRQLLEARVDSGPCIAHEKFELHRFRGEIYVVQPPAAGVSEEHLHWQGQASIDVPGLGGALQLERTRGAGIDLAQLRGRQLTLRFRRGGERLRLWQGGPSRTLKNLLQESAVPPWERDRLPLLFRGEELVWVAGVGVDVAFQCLPGGEGVLIRWKPNDQVQEA